MDITYIIILSSILFFAVTLFVIFVIISRSRKCSSNENKELSSQLNNAKNELNKLKNEKKDLENNISSDKNPLNSVDNTKSEIIKLDEQINNYENQINLLQKEVNELPDKIKLYEAKISDNKNQILKFENEIIDYKNQIQDSNKKNADLELEIKNLQDYICERNIKIEELETKISTLELELNSIKENHLKNITKIQELEKKDLESKEVLDVIRKLTSAIDVDNTNKKSKERDMVKNQIDEIIKEVDKMDILSNEYEFFRELEDNFFRWKDIEEKPWLRNKTTIAIMGKFSSGKSSLINTLIDGDILGTDVRPTTAVPTYITNDIENSNDIKFLNPHGKIKKIDNDSFSVLSNQQKIQNVPLRDLCKYFIISSDKDFFRDTSILDTPGYDEDKNNDLEAAIETIRESDVIFWTIDINEGEIKNDALEFIKKHLSGKDLVIILNKIDSKSPTERDEVKEKVISTLKSNLIKYKDVLFFSSKKNKQNLLKEEFIQYKSILTQIIKITQYNNKIDLEAYVDSKLNNIKDEINNRITKSNNKINENEKKTLLEQVKLNELQSGILNKYKDIDNFISDPNKTKDRFWNGGKKIDEKDWPEFNRRIAVAKKTSEDNIKEMEKCISLIGEYKKENLIEEDNCKKYRNYINSIGCLKGDFKKVYRKIVYNKLCNTASV